jgi:hypothetical protein
VPIRKKKRRNLLEDPRYLEFCARYKDNFVDYLIDMADHKRDVPVTFQQFQLGMAVQEPGCRVSVASGHGCFGKGFQIRMYDGSVKLVEDIKRGDILMGNDFTPRTVISTIKGAEEMFRFHFDKQGQDHVYNASHLLVMVDGMDPKRSEYYRRIKVDDWLSDISKRFWTCVRVSDEGDGYVKYLFSYIHKVKSLGHGAYYGFTLDGNSLFLSADGFVTSNTGKSFSLARVCDWHLRCYPKSNALLTATNIKQVSSVIWKELDGAIESVERNYPFLKGYFTKKAERYFQNDYKDSWYVMPKTASKGAPENLAGQHNDNYMVIVDEASAVPDEIHEVLQGALTHENNRYIMVSQPTRAAGHFYDSHHSLRDIVYKALSFNSEESPLVSLKFIRENLLKYNGHSSPEYQIRVLGCFPDNLEGFLIARQWVEIAQKIVTVHVESWGYIMTVDVAEGMHRDSSVFNIWKVSGYGDTRVVEHVLNYNSKTINEKQFARYIYNVHHDYPNITIAVDADGPGRTVILELDEMGVQCEQIRWGLPCHSKADQKRYKNQRAYASVKAREAIMGNRIRLQPGKTVVDQASRIPYRINEKGQYEIWSKERMRAEGIRSPDEFDTVCFVFLTDYVPVETSKSEESDKYLQWAREALEGRQN